MKKPLIATTFSGLFVRQEPWEKAHILWYKNASEKLKDSSVNEWVGKPNYFEGVDLVMQRLYPKLSDKERTKKAREMFFESVLEYMKLNPKVKNNKIIKYFQSLKEKYRLALITTNTSSALRKMLSITSTENLFDIIETSKLEEKDDKVAVFRRFIERHGKPRLYIGTSEESLEYCEKRGIKCISIDLENKENRKRKSVKSLDELKVEIEKAMSSKD